MTINNMNPFGNSGGDDFFGGGKGGSFGNPMGGMGGGPMGGMGGMMGGPPMMGRGGMGGGNPRQGGYSFSSTFDSSRPEGQQYQEHHEPFGDYAGSRGGGGGGPMSGMGGGGGQEHAPRDRGLMFSGLTCADNLFRQSRTAGAGRAAERPSYQGGGAGQQRYMHPCGGGQDPRYGAGYEDPRAAGQYGQGSRSGRIFDFGGSHRQQPSGPQGYYEDDSDLEDEGYRPQQHYVPQQSYGGGSGGCARRTGGGGGGGRQFFNFDRNGRKND
ncbi:hypothetical protein BKA58DRAFT_5042 [Alternaria rosae]|uniref:uncharacterized protein n=1 Tax=Alternaria rosae TaxID=1187941 RepID=UPI001E8D5D40|nr:uncharacterized protein BKA58DRAFT_5042 [Alternaria rosae]KAH6881566.1 hypothetical protein BKA58DRAFT_5042 [Alternaria rosae]